MPVDLPEAIDREKNRLDTPYCWLWLLDITISGVSDVLRFVNNVENIVYNNYTYNSCNFKLSPIQRSSAGEFPQRTLSISNVNLVDYLLPYVEDYDGCVGAEVIATPVNVGHLDLDMSNKAQKYKITETFSREDWIVFTLGAPSPLTQRFPSNRYFGLHCRYVRYFKGVECGYVGAETSCNGTLKRCRELSNQVRFGGQPGIRSKTVRFV